ncbi:MAG: DUF2809 domain-containing protein [Clostridia bacterium]|nr:DUF2809 domain-containing protein [Clostridia bacterium]
MMKNKSRLTYIIIFILLFAVEVAIAVLVHDDFVRPFIGDVLVVMLVCAFLRIIFPERSKIIPVFATLFAVIIEILQYFDFVKLLGLENNVILSTALGRTFDIRDIICYIVGGAIFFTAEILIRRKSDEH